MDEFSIENVIVLYSNMIKIFEELKIKRDKSYDAADFKDIFNFGVIPNGLSILKNYIIDNYYALTNFLNIRNIIEYLALKAAYDDKVIDQDTVELMRYEGYIMDYFTYDDYDKSLEDQGLINIEKLNIDYNNSLEEYKKRNRSIDLKKKHTFHYLPKNNQKIVDLIKKCKPSYLESYNLLSLLVHPHDYRFIAEKDNLDKIIVSVITELFELYFNKNITKIYDIEKNNDYLNIIIDEINSLNELKIENTKINGESNFLNYFIENINNIILDINTDYMFNLKYSCKMKFKLIAETFACYDKLLFNNPHSYAQTNLFKFYTRYNFKLNNDLNSFINEYINILNNEFDIGLNPKDGENLIKLGLSFFATKNIDENSDCKFKIPYLIDIVDEYLEKIYKDKKVNDSNVTLKNLYKLDYLESIKISHGNGYLYFANEGALNDCINVISAIDRFILEFLKSCQLNLLLSKNVYKELILFIKTTYDKLIAILREKNKILLNLNVNI